MTDNYNEFVVEDKRKLDDAGNLKSAEGAVADTPVPERKPPSMAAQIMAQDLLGAFIKKGLMGQYYQVGMASGKIERVGQCFRQSGTDSPWIFSARLKGRKCEWQQHISSVFGFVPRRCRNCWKTVVYPRNIVELIKLKNLQEAMVKADPACVCKCGIELRPEVERNYGGYFYNNTRAGGLARCEQVKLLVEKHVGKGIRVLLKRGCTEFERDFGDSKEWDKFAAFNDLEDEIDRNTYYEDDDHDQSPLVKAHVLASWLRFAASISDPAFLELSDGERMYPDYSTYDKEKKDEEAKPEEGRIARPDIKGYVPQGSQQEESR